MTSPALASPSAKFSRSKLPGTTLVFGLLLAGGLSASAQSVILPPTSVSNTPPSVTAQNPPSESNPPSQSVISPLQWGVVNFHPHFFYRFLYGDGLQSTPGNQRTSSVNSFSLGLLANIGTHWTFDYTPTKTYYSDDAFKDTLDHSVRLLGTTTYENWSFNLSQTFTSSFTPLIETGQQTSEDSYGTVASAGYHLNDRVQLDTNLNYQARFTTVFPDSRDTTIGERVHYQFSPLMDVSASLDYGWVNMSEGIDMTYTRPGVQLNWKATNKTTVNLQAGYENRRFKTGGADDLNSPTFGAGIQFRPFPTTTLNLTANKGVAIAYFTNQVTRNTGWAIDLQQRLFQHYYLSAGYSGQKSTYISTDPTMVAGRDDENYSFNIRLSTMVLQRVNVAILYQNAHNNSNVNGFGFTSSQVGVELGYQF